MALRWEAKNALSLAAAVKMLCLHGMSRQHALTALPFYVVASIHKGHGQCCNYPSEAKAASNLCRAGLTRACLWGELLDWGILLLPARCTGGGQAPQRLLHPLFLH